MLRAICYFKERLGEQRDTMLIVWHLNGAIGVLR